MDKQIKSLFNEIIDRLKKLEGESNGKAPNMTGQIIEIEAKLSIIEEHQQDMGETVQGILKRINEAEANRKWKFHGIQAGNVYFTTVTTYDPDRPYVKIPKENVKYIITKEGNVSVERAYKDYDGADIPSDLLEAIESTRNDSKSSKLLFYTPLMEQIGLKERESAQPEEPRQEPERKPDPKTPVTADEYLKMEPLTEGQENIVKYLEKNPKIPKSEAFSKLRRHMPKGEDVKQALFVLKTKELIKITEEEGREFIEIASTTK